MNTEIQMEVSPVNYSIFKINSIYEKNALYFVYIIRRWLVTFEELNNLDLNLLKFRLLV